MDPDDHVCLCFRVSKRKIVNFYRRERPPHASLASECLGAGTGCQWCVPFLRKLHRQVMAGLEDPDLPVSPGEYAQRRASYRQSGRREEGAGEGAGEGSEEGAGPP
ncbi:MAG: (2Fe-2S)-binding protein [Phycisphaerae bacterium]|nr:(2Fe-2S)-binding protein [Phycisphaerae bacterium]